MAHKVTVNVSDDAWKFAEQFADYKTDAQGEDSEAWDRQRAIEFFVNVTAPGRLRALHQYAEKRNDEHSEFKAYAPLAEAFADERDIVKAKEAKLYKKAPKAAKVKRVKATAKVAAPKGAAKPASGKKGKAKDPREAPKVAKAAKEAPKAIDASDSPAVALAKAEKLADHDGIKTDAAILKEAGRNAKGEKEA